VVIHRLLREGDPAFREEFLTFTQRVRILQLSNFKDDSSPIGPSVFLQINFTSCFIWLIIFLFSNLLNFLLCSLGLFFMGSHIRFVFGGKTRMLQGLEV
jgi:hypothetical protein